MAKKTFVCSIGAIEAQRSGFQVAFLYKPLILSGAQFTIINK
jgi:hypothetical protein